MNVYLWPNQSLMKNAYIGEVFEYSYDFRNKTISQLESDGWDFFYNKSYASGTADWVYWGTTLNQSVMFKQENLSTKLPNAKKVTITTVTKSDYTWIWARLYRVATSTTRSDITWMTYQVPSSRDSNPDRISYWIYGTQSNVSITRSNYANKPITQTFIIDFEENKMYLSNSEWYTNTVTLTATQSSNIKNNSIWYYLSTWAYWYFQSFNIVIE